MKEDRYAFLTEWSDPTASLKRRFQLFFYPKDNSVEMFDLKYQRMFLRRTKYDDLHLEDLFLENRVTVFSRQLKLIDYGDQFTANKLGSKIEKTLALVKPDVLNKIGDIFELIYSAKLIVTKAKMTKITWSQAADFYVEHQSKPFFNNLIQFITSGPVVAMELTGDKAMCIWRTLLGPADSAVARQEVPQSLRAKFGTDTIQNVCHGSESLAAAARELEFFFPSTVGHGPGNTAVCEDSTCCIIKPHAIAEGQVITYKSCVKKILFNIDYANAEEFYEIYRGVVMEYPGMVAELCSGPCIVLEIQGADIPKSFRELCGPSDPEIARLLRPNTLRGLYGKDKVRNAVHCTDLPEDSVLEVQYFFRILDG
uniref:Nucleoside diphosphate kinase homolog 7 n=1 Tax=Poecilia reticulata TaxID=8081 RepID=A0A3P9PTC5_POERE